MSYGIILHGSEPQQPVLVGVMDDAVNKLTPFMMTSNAGPALIPQRNFVEADMVNAEASAGIHKQLFDIFGKG